MRAMKTTSKWAVLALAVAVFGCSGELTNSAAPVELVVTNTQNLNIVDIGPNADDDPECDQDIGTINMQVFAKREVTGPATSVRVNRYRVSYQRTDGGRLVPAPFVRSIDTLIAIGGSAGLTDFLIIEPDALTMAPFAALQPQNGGRDPDTGRPFVQLEVIVEIFGETLGGDNVYDATRFPLDFCYGCGCD
jgi:hypothetical protein